jgi:hypothetical protein
MELDGIRIAAKTDTVSYAHGTEDSGCATVRMVAPRRLFSV